MLGPNVGRCREKHGPNAVVAIGITKEALTVQLAIPTEFVEQPAVATPDISPDDFQIKGQRLTRSQVPQGEGPIGYNGRPQAMGLPVKAQLRPKVGLGCPVNQFNCFRAASGNGECDQAIGHNQVMGQKLSAGPFGRPGRVPLHIRVRFANQTQSTRTERVDRLPAVSQGCVFAIQDDGQVEPLDVVTGVQFLESGLNNAAGDGGEQQSVEVLASQVAMTVDCSEERQVTRLQHEPLDLRVEARHGVSGHTKCD